MLLSARHASRSHSGNGSPESMFGRGARPAVRRGLELAGGPPAVSHDLPELSVRRAPSWRSARDLPEKVVRWLLGIGAANR